MITINYCHRPSIFLKKYIQTLFSCELNIFVIQQNLCTYFHIKLNDLFSVYSIECLVMHHTSAWLPWTLPQHLESIFC